MRVSVCSCSGGSGEEQGAHVILGEAWAHPAAQAGLWE